MNIIETVNAVRGLKQRLGRVRLEPEKATPVLSVKIKLLWQCNLACSFCKRPQSGQTLSRDIVTRALRGLADNGLRKVHFSGGEVLLHPEIHGIVNDAADMGLQVNLTSNGTLMDKDTIRLLEENVHSISLSLDAPTSRLHDRIRGKEGAFRATLKAARIIARRGRVHLRINTVLSSLNSRKMNAMYELVRGLGKDVRWKIIPVDTGNTELRPARTALAAVDIAAECWTGLDPWRVALPADTWAKEASRGFYGIGRSFCFAPWFHLFVDPAGHCFPCCSLRGRVQSWGSIHRTDAAEITRGKNATEFRMAMASGCYPGRCRRCDDFIEENESFTNITKGDAI